MTNAVIYNADPDQPVDARWWSDDQGWSSWMDATLFDDAEQRRTIERNAMPNDFARFIPATTAGILAKAEELRHDRSVAEAKRAIETLEADFKLVMEVAALLPMDLGPKFNLTAGYYTVELNPDSGDAVFNEDGSRTLAYVLGLDVGQPERYELFAWASIRKTSGVGHLLGNKRAVVFTFTGPIGGEEVDNAEDLLGSLDEWLQGEGANPIEGAP